MNHVRIVGVGEAMIELSPAGDGLYRLSYAGDTFNTIWHMAQLLGERASSGFVTRIGSDPLSSRFLADLKHGGLDARVVGRDDTRHMGLYLIELTGTERSFQYWRNDSAARALADRPELLLEGFTNADLVHVSGITLAVLHGQARGNLFGALSEARQNGARVSFDPNIRPRLWPSLEEARIAVLEMLKFTDIVLPSFDDEKMLWNDASPVATLRRYRCQGLFEVVVKNGADAVTASMGDDELSVPTSAVDGVRDTTGAGDAFNAGYLSARCLGLGQVAAVRTGQAMSAEVLKHPGARAPMDIARDMGRDLFGSHVSGTRGT